MMLKRHATEIKINVKDRMMLIIKIKRNSMGVREAAKSLEKPDSCGYKSVDGIVLFLKSS